MPTITRAPIGPLQRLYNAKELAAEVDRRDIITPAQHAKGTYESRIHPSQGRRMTNRSSILDRWFADREPGFDEGARLAIEWCHKRWEARGTIGSLTASYEPATGSGGQCEAERGVMLRDELDEVKGWFHPAHWDVFEGVVRWGQPAGVAGSELADNPAQAIASARVVVGMIASFIAARKGY